MSTTTNTTTHKPMAWLLGYRFFNLLLVAGAVVGMGFAWYLQEYQHLDPCPLCIFQRVGLISMGVFALIAFVHHPRHIWLRRMYSLLAFLGISWSVGVASRHVWLQHLPPEDVPACGPGLDYWMDTFPMNEVVRKVLHGSGECAKVDWTFLGWSLPHWSLLFFLGLAVIALWQLVRPHHELRGI